MVKADTGKQMQRSANLRIMNEAAVQMRAEGTCRIVMLSVPCPFPTDVKTTHPQKRDNTPALSFWLRRGSGVSLCTLVTQEPLPEG
jgi:hypothetical protein